MQKYQQYGAGIASSFLAISGGTVTSWTTSTLPILLSDESPVGKISDFEASLITSLLLFGSMFGNLTVGPVLNFFGRKGSLLMCGVPIFILWLAIMYASSVLELYIERFLIGFIGALPIAASIIYTTEIAEPHVRGKFGVLGMLMMELGQLLVTTAGVYMTYKNVALLCALLPIIFIIIFWWFPESPYHYLRKGDKEMAGKCLARLRSSSITKELNAMHEHVQIQMKNKSRLQDMIINKEYRKKLLIMIGLKSLQQLSGSVAIQSYMGVIFMKASTGLNPQTSTIVCSAITIPSMLISLYIVDKFGRKPLYYVSTLGCTVALLLEFTYFYLQDNQDMDMESLSWLPVSGILLFYIFRALGVSSLPVLIMGELFPTNIKGIAVSISLLYGSVISFLVLLLFPLLVKWFGLAIPFLIFAVCCLLGFIFVLCLLPETKGKTLNDVQTNN